MEYVQPIRDVERIQDIADYLRKKDEKYYVMFEIGINSGLRVCDILKLKVRDVRNKKNITMREKKTKKLKSFPINKELKKVITDYIEGKDDAEFLVPSSVKIPDVKAISRERAWQVIKEAGKHYQIDDLGTHTMRKTFGYHFYLKTKDIVMLQKIFNHSSPQITLRYIGIEQDSINAAMSRFSYR